MQIKLISPCSAPKNEMPETAMGCYCKLCNKEVIDFTNMTDTQILLHISTHGLGCGTFSQHQLDRELTMHTKRKGNRLFYFPLLFALFFKTVDTKAQCRPKLDTITQQLPTTNKAITTINNNKYNILVGPAEDATTLLRLGGATVMHVYKYIDIPFTPMRILRPRHWFGYRRGIPIIRFGKIYVPFLKK
jgi:hypothetical protein